MTKEQLEQENQILKKTISDLIQAIEEPQKVVDSDFMYCITDKQLLKLPYRYVKKMVRKIVSVIISRQLKVKNQAIEVIKNYENSNIRPKPDRQREIRNN